MKILLDTDIGTDSDDAVCLAYLLVRPDCELLGVTTLGPDAVIRADIARKLCTHMGQPDIPVVAGFDAPMLSNPYWNGHQVNQAVILDEPPQARPSTPADAVQLMRSVIRDNPGEVVLLSVGPLSNVALLALSDPQCLGMLKATYSMCGLFPNDLESPQTECNTMLDPASSHAVFARHLPEHTVFGLNVTRGMKLDARQLEDIFAGEALKPVRDCCGAWIEAKKSPGTGLHDPFTAACIFDPSFCTYEQGRIGIRLVHHNLKDGSLFPRDKVNGFTYFEPEANGPHRVAVTRDADRYIQHLHDAFAPAR